MAYKYDYIKERASVEWQRKVDEIRQRDNYTCQICGAKDKQVQVHHTWYNQKLHYWEYPNEQLITLCKDCHSRETELVRNFKGIKSTLDVKIVTSIESLMKQGILLTSISDVLKQLESNNIKISMVDTNSTLSHSHQPASLSIEEKKQLFIKTLRPFESKYDKDYIQTFLDFWLAEKAGRLRIEVNENGYQMDLLGLTPEYVGIKLEHWKRKYDIIMAARQSPFILDEIRREVNVINKDYESKNIELRCNTAMDEDYSFIQDNRLFGKILYDRGLFLKTLSEHDSFLQTDTDFTLCCPIDSIEEKEQRAFSDFCLLYEANQAFKRNKEYNAAILSSISPENTYRSFCDKYGIYYGHNLKKEKTIKEIIDSLPFPIKLKYYAGSIKIDIRCIGNQKRLSKLNEVFGLQVVTTQCVISTYITVPHKVLYVMDGEQFDFRDDSFENGTMKSIKLPSEYKNAHFYIEKIEELISKR